MAQHQTNIEKLRKEGEDAYRQLKHGIQKCKDFWYLKSEKLSQIIDQADEIKKQLTEHYSTTLAKIEHLRQGMGQLEHGNVQAQQAEQALRKEADIVYDLIQRLTKAINEARRVLGISRNVQTVAGIASIFLIPIASSLPAIWSLGFLPLNIGIGLSSLSFGLSLFKSSGLSFGLNFSLPSVNVGIEPDWGGDVSPADDVQPPSLPF